MTGPVRSNVVTIAQGTADERSSPYASGTVIAEKYKLSSVIGEGGMGSVWRARNLLLHVDVAIKLIHSDIASDEADQRLLTEARSAAQLKHPAIVSVHDFGITDHGDPYIVMELLDGESLGDVLERKSSLAATKGVQMLLPVLDALSSAHAKGIVHRDIKPDNVILMAESSGRVFPKVVDFGIAKVDKPLPPAGTYGAGEAARASARLTQAGRLIGSPGYMAPEQARGAEVDERADVWATSVVLYEAITGQPPFETDDLDETLIRVLIESPTPITVSGAGDEELWQIIERGLRKTPEDRWQSTEDLGRALARWLVGQGVSTDITGTSIREHWLDEDHHQSLSEVPAAPPSRATGEPAAALPSAAGDEHAGEPARSSSRWRYLPWGIAAAALLVAAGVAVTSNQAREAEQGVAQPAAAAPAAEPSTSPAEAPQSAGHSSDEPAAPSAELEGGRIRGDDPSAATTTPPDAEPPSAPPGAQPPVAPRAAPPPAAPPPAAPPPAAPPPAATPSAPPPAAKAPAPKSLEDLPSVPDF